MKKIYNAPTLICVELRTVNMMATSEYSIANISSVTDGSDGDYIDTKGFKDVNLWDEEW